LAETPTKVDVGGKMTAQRDGADFGGVGNSDCKQKRVRRWSERLLERLTYESGTLPMAAEC
jgi:hypothetical protein